MTDAVESESEKNWKSEDDNVNIPNQDTGERPALHSQWMSSAGRGMDEEEPQDPLQLRDPWQKKDLKDPWDHGNDPWSGSARQDWKSSAERGMDEEEP